MSLLLYIIINLFYYVLKINLFYFCLLCGVPACRLISYDVIVQHNGGFLPGSILLENDGVKG